MLRTFNALRGFAIRATDGRIGTVSDIYFDDHSWRVRHCVVDSDRWFAERYVLIAPRSLSVVDSARQELWVRLAKAEVARSRRADTDKPVSRQGGGVITSIRRLGRWSSLHRRHPATALPDRHLRSCRAIIGNRLKAIDGVIGRVDDLLIDDKGWTIRALIVDTGDRRLASPRVVVAAPQVGAISWPAASVSIGLTRDAVLAAPVYAPLSSEATLCS